MLDVINQYDRALFSFINTLFPFDIADNIFWLLSFVGEGAHLAIVGCIGLFLFDRRRFPKNFLVFAIVLMLTGAFNGMMKKVIDKPRPMGNAALVGQELTISSEKFIPPLNIRIRDVEAVEEYGSLRIVGRKYKQHGLPSGHTAAAVGFAICLIYGFRSNWRWLWLLFSMGIAWSRIHVGAHLPLDLLGGAVIGTVLPLVMLRTTEIYHGLGARRRPHHAPSGPYPVIAMVAGEASADAYGANLIRKLRIMDSTTRVIGIGGDQMQEAGLNRIHHSKDLSIVGFTAVLSSLGRIRRIYKDMLTLMREKNPQVLVVIDLPDFNLMLANQAQSMGIRVVYYISPQVWAWRYGRIHTISARADQMVVAFPFEKEIYEKVNLKTHFFGHPLLEILAPRFDSREKACAHFGLDPGKKIVIVAVGSRKNEIDYLAGDLFETGARLAKELPEYQFAVPLAPNVDKKHLRSLAKVKGFYPVFTEGDYRDLCNIAHFGIITSGTATFEAALLGCPMIIVYKGHPINIAIAKKMVTRIVDFGLPNIVLGKQVFPELLQEEVTPDRIESMALEIIRDEEKYSQMKDHCRLVREKLVAGDTSDKVAGVVMEVAQKQLDSLDG